MNRTSPTHRLPRDAGAAALARPPQPLQRPATPTGAQPCDRADDPGAVEYASWLRLLRLAGA